MSIKIRVRTLERSYGEQTAEIAGLSPLINQLLKLDRMAALRYLFQSRRILYQFIQSAQKQDGKKNQSGISASELITSLNKMLFDNNTIFQDIPENIEKEFIALTSVIQHTAFVFFLDNIDIPQHKRKRVLDALEKAFGTIKAVYAPIAGKTLKKDSQSFIEIFKLRFPEKVNSEQQDKVEELPLDITSTDTSTVKEDDTEQNDVEQSIAKPDDTKLLSRKEVAKIFDISLPTLANWEKNGSIPKAVRTSGRVYFRKSDIEKHLNNTNSSKEI